MTSFSIKCLQQHHCNLEMVRDTTTKESLTTLMFLQQMCNWCAGWPNSTGNSLRAHTFTIRVKNIHISTHTNHPPHTASMIHTHIPHTLTHHLHDPHIHTTHARTHAHLYTYKNTKQYSYKHRKHQKNLYRTWTSTVLGRFYAHRNTKLCSHKHHKFFF